jgi:hypothetical protein
MEEEEEEEEEEDDDDCFRSYRLLRVRLEIFKISP